MFKTLRRKIKLMRKINESEAKLKKDIEYLNVVASRLPDTFDIEDLSTNQKLIIECYTERIMKLEIEIFTSKLELESL